MTLPIRRFRSQPVEVEAVLVTEENADEVAAWCGGVAPGGSPRFVSVPTANGPANAPVGTWVVKSSVDFYPCAPEVFKQRWIEAYWGPSPEPDTADGFFS